MKTQWMAPARLQTTALLAALVFAAAAAADPIPPAEFSFDVFQGGMRLGGCVFGSPSGGSCGSELSGPGFAATSGGIGTESYLPLTPGGTVLGPGTAVDAASTWTSGAPTVSVAKMTYSFEATGPASVQFIPIDVLSTGLASITGNGAASLSLVIRDAGTDANIPPGVADPDPQGPLLDLSASCSHGTCVSDWGLPGNLLTSNLCVVNGDNYTLTITAITGAGKHSSPGTASAILDPVIKLDPPYPDSCPVSVPLSELNLQTGPGASTGVSVPEPPMLTLALAGAFGLWLARRRPLLRSARR